MLWIDHLGERRVLPELRTVGPCPRRTPANPAYESVSCTHTGRAPLAVDERRRVYRTRRIRCGLARSDCGRRLAHRLALPNARD